MIQLMASKGVCGENPENTMPAFQAAVDQGYSAMELTARVTKDLQCVVLADHTVNRTARYADGSRICAALPVAEVTYDQLLELDFGIAYHVKFKGTKIPLLEDVLKLARSAGIAVKVTADCWKLRESHKEALFALLDGYADVAQLTCTNMEQLDLAAKRYPAMHLHYTGEDWDQIASDRVTIWVREAKEDLVHSAKQYGCVGVSSLTKKWQLEEAEGIGAEIVSTNGALKVEQNKGILSDMHVHTDHSHDAHYPMEQMLQKGIEHGMKFIAIADHCDVTRCENDPNWDIYTHIKEACAEVDELNQKYGDQCLLLRSVELGDGVWYPEQSHRVAEQLPYDVVVGAAHAVRCEAAESLAIKEKWFSQIKFLEVTEDQYEEFMNNYFDDMLAMVETQNIDIMAHIPCAIGYYRVRYGIWKDLRPYEKQIDKVLKAIIRKGIAMEMCDSLFAEHEGQRPYTWIVQKYYDLGGYLITLSTDAHAPGEVGMGYEKRIPILKEIGFTHILYYKDRKAVPCSL